jgi:hypothetical protein
MSTGEKPLSTVSGKNKLPFIPENFDSQISKNFYNAIIVPQYDLGRSNLLNKHIWTGKCQLMGDCVDFLVNDNKAVLRSNEQPGALLFGGCCAGLTIDFIQPDYDISNTLNDYVSFCKILFNSTVDEDLSVIGSFDIPNILSISHSAEIIISIIYGNNFENKEVNIYHPIINQIKNSSLTITLPKTNGLVNNINL